MCRKKSTILKFKNAFTTNDWGKLVPFGRLIQRPDLFGVNLATVA